MTPAEASFASLPLDGVRDADARGVFGDDEVVRWGRSARANAASASATPRRLDAGRRGNAAALSPTRGDRPRSRVTLARRFRRWRAEAEDVDEEPWTRRTASRASVGPAAPARTDASPPGTASGAHGDAGSGGGVRADGFRGVGNADGVGRAGDDTDEYGEEPAWVGGEEVEDAENKARERGLGAQALGFLALPAARASASLRRSSASSRSSSESSASVSSASVSRESPSTPDPASRDPGGG